MLTNFNWDQFFLFFFFIIPGRVKQNEKNACKVTSVDTMLFLSMPYFMSRISTSMLKSIHTVSCDIMEHK